MIRAGLKIPFAVALAALLPLAAIGAEPAFLSVSPDSLPAPLAEVAARWKADSNFTAAFQQARTVPGLRLPMQSSGIFRREGGGALRFDQDKPFARSMRISKDGIEEKLPDGQVRRFGANQPFAKGILASLSTLFSGDFKAAATQFDARWAKAPQGWKLQLRPRGLMAKMIADIRIEGDTLLRRVEVREVQGGSTLIHFSPVP